jgi:hypothetical protein
LGGDLDGGDSGLFFDGNLSVLRLKFRGGSKSIFYREDLDYVLVVALQSFNLRSTFGWWAWPLSQLT